MQLVNPEFENKIISALADTVSNNNDVRQKAEQSLKEAKHTPGYATALLKISADTNLQGKFGDTDLNHAASIQFGQLIEVHWKFKNKEQSEKVATQGFDYVLIDPNDKQLVRDSLMDAIKAMATHKKIQKQYIRSLKMICVHDYPDLLPGLFPQIMAMLEQQDEISIYAGLQGLLALASRYEFEFDEDRIPLHDLIKQSFGKLGQLVNLMIQKMDNLESLQLLHLVCKVFYVSNQLQVCPWLMEGDNLDPWMGLFKTILDMQCPPELCSHTTVTSEMVAKDKHIFWKIKGIAAKVTYRIFIKYSNPVIVEQKDIIKSFSTQFRTKYSVSLLESHLQIMFAKKTQFVGSKALNFAIKFTSASTKQQITMDKIKPFVDDILQNVIVPIMLVSEQDVEQFQNEPIEYIRSQYDFTETMLQPKNQVQDLLQYLCKYSSEKVKKSKKGKRILPKPDYLFGYIQWAVKNLKEYDQMVAAGQNPDWRIKEALMYTIGTLRDEIMNQKTMKNEMEQMLVTFVLPELKNPQPFLRQRACQTYGVFDFIKFQDMGHVEQVVEGISMNMIEDQPLPVRFQAACALEKILKIEKAMSLIKPKLDVILKCYLGLMHELDNEELVAAFESLMTIFQDDIGPYAAEICLHLRKQYQRLIAQDAQEDEGESILAAVASFTSIRRILDAIQDDKSLLLQVEDIIYPCLLHSLTPDGLDAIEEGIDCITMLVYHLYKDDKPLSENLWKLFPQLLYVCAGEDGDMEGGYGFEYVNQIADALKNYVSRDPDGMLKVPEGETKSHLQLTFHFIVRCLAVNRNGEGHLDGVTIMGFIVALLENMSGKLNQELPQILTFLLDELKFCQTKEHPPKQYTSMILQAIAMTFAYDPVLTFQWLEANNYTVTVFGIWLQFFQANEFKKDFEVRRNLFGLSAILKTQQLPQIVQARIHDIMVQIVKLTIMSHKDRVETLKDNQKYIANGGKDSDESDDEDDANDIIDENDAGQDSEEEFANSKDMLGKMGAKFAKGQDFTEEELNAITLKVGDDDSDDEDYDFNGGDSLSLYDSRIDNIDELKTLKDTLSVLDPNVYSQLTNSVDPQNLASFNEILTNLDQFQLEESKCKQDLEALENKNNQ